MARRARLANGGSYWGPPWYHHAAAAGGAEDGATIVPTCGSHGGPQMSYKWGNQVNKIVYLANSSNWGRCWFCTGHTEDIRCTDTLGWERPRKKPSCTTNDTWCGTVDQKKSIPPFNPPPKDESHSVIHLALGFWPSWIAKCDSWTLCMQGFGSPPSSPLQFYTFVLVDHAATPPL